MSTDRVDQRLVIRQVPFHRSTLGVEEIAAVSQALEAGHLIGNGPLCHRAETALRQQFGIPYVLLTTSGTSAMELALLTLGIGPGMEVLLPSWTFVSCATAIIRCGARPVFVDVDPDTLMLNPDQLDRAITKRSRAILCVHYGGFPCDMHRIMAVAHAHRLLVIEDAAQALGSFWRGRPLGTIGDVGCLSFHGTKNITCGEGGAFLTNNSTMAERALLMREKGTNREAFLRGEVNRYTWVERGGSFVLSDLLAAILLVQLGRLAATQRARQTIGLRYLDGLQSLAANGRAQLPKVDDPSSVNWHTMYLLVSSGSQRDRVLRALRQAGIEACFHFIPLHSSPYGRRHYGYRPEDLPVTEDVARRLIRLPMYPGLAQDDQDYVIATLHTLLS